MFDFDASKLLIIGVVALVVIGPKDLPRVLRQVGQMVGKLRRMAAEFQGQFMDAMKEADLADLQKEVGKLKDSASLDVNFNPVHDIRTSIITSVGSTSVAMPAAAATASAEAVPASTDAPAIRGAVSALDADPIYLEPAEPAHRTPAESAGAVGAVEAGAGDRAADGGHVGRRRILVAKRRPPGDRLAAQAAFTGRGRPILPPRRDPRP